jgi:hypothetical protein
MRESKLDKAVDQQIEHDKKERERDYKKHKPFGITILIILSWIFFLLSAIFGIGFLGIEELGATTVSIIFLVNAAILGILSSTHLFGE